MCSSDLALQGINSREVNPNEIIVVNVCMVHSGTACNITPEYAQLQGTIRTMNEEVRTFAKKRLVEISQMVGATYRGECTVEFESKGVPPMENNPSLLNELKGYINDLFERPVTVEGERMTGSEDFSVISKAVPSVLFWVGFGSDEEGYPYGVHDSRVIFNEAILPIMATIYAGGAMRWLKENR